MAKITNEMLLEALDGIQKRMSALEKNIEQLEQKTKKSISIDCSVQRDGDSFELKKRENQNNDDNIEKLVIPEGITKIETCEFENYHNLKTIVFPTTLETIGVSAFENCTNLESLTFNEGLLSIEFSAFGNCKNLKEISLPNSLENIEAYAFRGCHSVKFVNCNTNKRYSFLDKCLIENGDTIIESFGNPVPHNPQLINISEGAFSEYRYDGLTIPANIKDIAYNAFPDCSAVRKLKINHDVYIESYAFNFDKLTEIELSFACANFEKGAFSIPHNNMLNVYVDDTKIPDGVAESITLKRYNHYMGSVIDPSQPSGTHNIWTLGQWAQSMGMNYPTKKLVYEGQELNAYFVGYGFETIDSTLKIAIAFVDSRSRPTWEKYENKMAATRIELEYAIVDDINYAKHRFDTIIPICDFEPCIFYLDSAHLLKALKSADQIKLGFDVLDSDENIIDIFSFSLLL